MEGLYTVNLLGKDRDIYFGMSAVEYVYLNIDDTAFQRMSTGGFAAKDVGVIAHLLYAGLMGGAELNAEKFTVKYKEVYALIQSLMLEGDTGGIMEAAGKAFSESVTIKYMAKGVKKGKKKESTGGKSTD